MKVKEVNRTANIAWSPAPQYPIYLAAGTAAQQLDATFRYIQYKGYLVESCVIRAGYFYESIFYFFEPLGEKK